MRLFVSVDPPAHLASELVRLVALAEIPGARVVAPDRVHLTAMFIGEVRSLDLNDVVESVARSASGLGPFDLTIASLATLPETGPPRLIAALADLPAPLAELHRRLVHRLARRSRERSEFLPHLTLARFGPASASPLNLPKLAEPLRFRVEAVALKHSVIAHDHSEHRVLQLISLT